LNNSRLYNERTYVLSRIFIKRAIDAPPKGFEEEIRAYYLDGIPLGGGGGVGALSHIIDYAQSLLEESERVKADSAVESLIWAGQRVLTEGGCISLRRTVAALSVILQKEKN
jgi:ubiquitin-conjugating enzyme E2 O